MQFFKSIGCALQAAPMYGSELLTYLCLTNTDALGANAYVSAILPFASRG
jgi:hypothetical protein